MDAVDDVSGRLKNVPERVKSPEPVFDVLGDVLDTLRCRGAVFYRSDLALPWGIALDDADRPRFHIAISGDCFVSSDDGKPLAVPAMSIVMLPNGHAHWIADRPGRALIESRRAQDACELGCPEFQQGEITHRLICGLVQYEEAAVHPLIDSLPNVLLFPRFEAHNRIWVTVGLIDAEMSRPRGNSSRIVDRLTEILLLQLLDHYATTFEAPQGFFAALRDRRVHRALELIHSQPERDWTLAALGDDVGMSRATLNRHFHSAVGVAPMAYICSWRTTKAFNLVKYSSQTLEQIAAAVGFASARTLSRAFRRRYGITPNELRHQASEVPGRT